MSIAPIALTDRQRRVLAEMGIDVWIRRSIAPAAVATALPGRSEPIRSQEPTPQTPIAPVRLQPSASAAELRVSLDSVAAPGIVAVGEFSNPLDHRLAQDILLAIAGMNSKLQKAQFRWPQTQTGDSSPGAARNAYRGFLRGQLDRANARLLLLFGTNAASLLDYDVQPGLETMQLSDARALRADPNAKRALWLNVSRRTPA